jgi:hypothetical protein
VPDSLLDPSPLRALSLDEPRNKRLRVPESQFLKSYRNFVQRVSATSDSIPTR